MIDLIFKTINYY